MKAYIIGSHVDSVNISEMIGKVKLAAGSSIKYIQILGMNHTVHSDSGLSTDNYATVTNIDVSGHNNQIQRIIGSIQDKGMNTMQTGIIAPKIHVDF